MSILSSILLGTALASQPTASDPPSVSCRLVTRSQNFLELGLKPRTQDGRAAVVFEGLSDGSAALSGLIDETEAPKTGAVYNLIRDQQIVGSVRIAGRGPIQTVTIYGLLPDHVMIPAAFGFCTENATDQGSMATVANDEFLYPENWKSGCGMVSPALESLMPLERKTTFVGDVRVYLTRPGQSPYNAPRGSVLKGGPAGTGESGEFISIDLIEDAGKGASGRLISYVDENLLLGSQTIVLNRHAAAEGRAFGLCSQKIVKIGTGSDGKNTIKIED